MINSKLYYIPNKIDFNVCHVQMEETVTYLNDCNIKKGTRICSRLFEERNFSLFSIIDQLQ